MNKSIRSRFIFLFLLFTVVPVLVSGVLISWYSYRSQRDHAIEHQTELAQHKAELVQNFILTIEDELRLTTELNDLKALTPEQLETNLNLLLKHNYVYEDIYLIDINQQHLGGVSQRSFLTPLGAENKWSASTDLNPLETGGTSYSPVYFHPETGEPFMTIMVAIKDVRTGEVTHGLGARVNLKSMQAVVTEASDQITDNVYILGAENDLIAHRNPSLVFRGTNFSPPQNSGIDFGLAGTPVILGLAEIRLGEIAWLAISERSITSALDLTLRLVAGVSTLILTALVATTVLGMLVMRQVIRPIESLAVAATEITSGNLSQRVRQKRDDELGALAVAFNSMATQLEDTFDSLESQVEERTRDLKLAQLATLSMMEDADEARHNAEQTAEELQAAQIATMNIMIDVDEARQRAEQANRDLTAEIVERVRVEESLILEKTFTDTIINSIPGIFYVFDDEGRFVRWNKNLSTFSEYSDDEIAQMNPLAFFRESDRHQVEARIQMAFYTGISDVEGYFATKSGREIPFYLTGYRTLIDDRLFLIGTGFDISERKLADDALAKRTQELERSNQELEQFAYVASHDLQEPLRMVASYLQLLERRYGAKLGEDAKDFIGFAVDGATRMKRLINDLLAYSRVGMRGNPFRTTNLNAVLEQVQSNLNSAIIESGAVISIDSLPTIYSDETQMLQLFQNLIGNAIKFSQPDTTPEISITVHQQAAVWEIAVRDNGIGFDQQFAERIFVIFQRLHGKNEYSGTGIGLAISKRIIERHGGRIWAESAPGEGATFKFTLPILETVASQPEDGDQG